MAHQSAEIAPCGAGAERVHRTPVTALAVSFDNVLNVQFSNERARARICGFSSAASVARWPMTDTHGVRVSPMAACCSGVSAIERSRDVRRILPSGGDSPSSPSDVSTNALGDTQEMPRVSLSSPKFN